ncbi:hypothetical protein AVEN_147251-1, partial [Araneus ventricosus]
TQGYFGMDLVNLNRGHMSRTILEPPLQTSAKLQQENVLPLTSDLRATGLHAAGSGFESGALRLQSRDLTTTPVQPMVEKFRELS